MKNYGSIPQIISFHSNSTAVSMSSVNSWNTKHRPFSGNQIKFWELHWLQLFAARFFKLVTLESSTLVSLAQKNLRLIVLELTIITWQIQKVQNSCKKSVSKFSFDSNRLNSFIFEFHHTNGYRIHFVDVAIMNFEKVNIWESNWDPDIRQPDRHGPDRRDGLKQFACHLYIQTCGWSSVENFSNLKVIKISKL